MPVAVNQIQRREEKDPLDTIVKGLTIAQGIFGIKDAGVKADQLRAQTQMQTALAEKQMAALDRSERGVLTAPEYFSKAGTIQEVLKGTPGASEVRVMRGGKEDSVYYQPIKQKDQENSGVALDIKKLTAEKLKRELSRDTDEKYRFEGLPKDSQIEAEALTRKVVDRKAVLNDMNALISQLKDPALPQDQKIKAGEMSLKLLNSVQGPDALSNDEAARVGNLLKYDFRPLSPGNLVGRDLDLFTKTIEDQADRIRLSAESMSNRVGSIMGRPERPVAKRLNISDDKKSDLMSVIGTNKANASSGGDGGFSETQDLTNQILTKRQGMKARLPK